MGVLSALFESADSLLVCTSTPVRASPTGWTFVRSLAQVQIDATLKQRGIARLVNEIHGYIEMLSIETDVSKHSSFINFCSKANNRSWCELD